MRRFHVRNMTNFLPFLDEVKKHLQRRAACFSGKEQICLICTVECTHMHLYHSLVTAECSLKFSVLRQMKPLKITS